MTVNGEVEVRNGLSALLPRLWRFALVLCRDNATADDLVQSTCIRALERASQFEAGSNLDRWAFTILASIWKNFARSEAIRRGKGLVEAADHLTVDTRPQMEASLLTQQVLTALDDMPDIQRSAVLLVYVEGWSYKEAAAALDIPLGTLMSRIGRARKSLARLQETDMPPAAPAQGPSQGARHGE